MTELKQNDLDSFQIKQWIKQYRNVDPVVLQPPDIDPASLKSLEKNEITSGLEAYSGEWTKQQTRHLLSRTLFGVKKSELDYFFGLSMEEAVELIIAESPIPDPPVNNYEGINQNAQDPHVDLGETWIEAPHAAGKEGLRIVSLKAWIINNILQQQPTIHEKLVLFWSNLLVTKVWDVYNSKASYKYYQMLYDNALGNYRSFIKNLTLDPSMLIFLNGTTNTRTEPDENYGRELQELFCIGKGPDSKYTEGDVQAAARVLTGWTFDWSTRRKEGPAKSFFDHFKHDKDDKKFSSFYGNKVIEGQLGGWGRDETDDLLDMIFENEETSKYICRRIYSFFVSNVISESVEENIISPLAEIFRNNNYELKPVLMKLFKSAHFYDVQNHGALIKSPADHLLGLWRTLGLKSTNTENLLENYRILRGLHWNLSNAGMEIGDPPTVAGWAPYYQAPQYDKAWITTDTITKRAKATDAILYWGFWISRQLRIKSDLPEFIASFDNPSDPNEMLGEAELLLLGVETSDETRSELKAILLSGQQQDYYWSLAWNEYAADPADSAKKQTVENRLKPVFKRILQLGESHLM